MTVRMTAAQLVAAQAKPKPRRDREGPIHRAILELLELVLPKGSIIHHSPNAIGLPGYLIAKQIKLNESMGTVKGFPDLICLMPGPVVWLFEVKADGNTPDKDQRELHESLRALGFKVGIARSTDDVNRLIQEWGGVPKIGTWKPNDYRDLRDRIVGEVAE